MDKKYLYQRHQTWWVQVRVPPSIQDVIGKKQLYRNLKTTDINEAVHLKYSVVGELKAQIASAKKSIKQESTKEDQLLETARLLKEQQADSMVSSEILEQTVYKIFGDTTADSLFNYYPAGLESDEVDFDQDPNQSQSSLSLKNKPDPNLLETVQKAFRILSEDSYTISQASERFLQEESRRIKKSTLVRKQKRIHEFIKWNGDDLIKKVTKESAGRFLTEYIMPQQLAYSTTKAFVLDLSTFFSLCKDRGMLENNPFENLTSTIKKSTTDTNENKRENWTQDDLVHLFKSLNVKDNLWALSAIGLYSGMRLEEICSMKTKHVKDGFMSIKGGKTTAALRVVPVHHVINDLVEYLISKSYDGYLLVGLKSGGHDNKRSWNIQKRFGRFRNKIGITETKKFHSLRKNFSTALENSQVPENIAQQLVGHSKKSMTYSLYSQGASDDVLKDAIEKVTYGPIDQLIKEQLRSLL